MITFKKLKNAILRAIRRVQPPEKHLCRDCAKVSEWSSWIECRFRYPGYLFFPVSSPTECDRFEPAPHTLMPDYDSMKEDVVQYKGLAKICIHYGGHYFKRGICISCGWPEEIDDG